MQRFQSPSRGKSANRSRSPGRTFPDLAVELVKDTIDDFWSRTGGDLEKLGDKSDAYSQKMREIYEKTMKDLGDDSASISRTGAISSNRRTKAQKLVTALSHLAIDLERDNQYEAGKTLKQVQKLKHQIAFDI